MSNPLDQPPPWQLFPDMQPWQVAARQGVQEAWVDQVWRPFWAGLSPTQRDAYLAHWQASEPWQQAIRSTFEADPGFDAAADLAESLRYREERAQADAAAHAPSWHQRLGRWLGKP